MTREYEEKAYGVLRQEVETVLAEAKNILGRAKPFNEISVRVGVNNEHASPFLYLIVSDIKIHREKYPLPVMMETAPLTGLLDRVLEDVKEDRGYSNVWRDL